MNYKCTRNVYCIVTKALCNLYSLFSAESCLVASNEVINEHKETVLEKSIGFVIPNY